MPMTSKAPIPNPKPSMNAVAALKSPMPGGEGFVEPTLEKISRGLPLLNIDVCECTQGNVLCKVDKL